MNVVTFIKYSFALMISVLRPILFKEYKKYISSTMLISILCLLIYSNGIFIYKYYTGIIDKEKLYEKMKKGISLKNVLISCISQIRFSLKFICISMLPLSISIPIAKLDIIFTEFFDYLINGQPITYNIISSTILLLIGIFILNYDKIMNNKSSDNYKLIYLIGLIISTILVGFINVYYSNYDKHNDVEDVMYTESAGALIIALIICYYNISRKKEKKPDIKTILTIFLVTLFIFNGSIVLKWELLKTEPLIRNQLIMNLSIPITFLIGLFYYKEKLNIKKFIGLIFVMTGIIYYVYTSNQYYTDKQK